MGKLGTIFGVLTLVTAVAVAGLSFLLFQRRAEFTGRANTLAKTVAGMAQRLDNESNTDVGSKVNFTPRNKEAGTPETGSLSWQAYHDAKGPDGSYADFDKTCGLALKLAVDINERRNALTDSLVMVAGALRMPEEALVSSDFKFLSDDKTRFQRATNSVFQLARATTVRDELMIQTLDTCSSLIGYNLDRDSFWTRREEVDADGRTVLGDFRSGPTLAGFTTKLQALNTRSKDYVQAIVDGINRVSKHEWATNVEQLNDEREYAGALTALLNDFDDINESLALYDKAKQEIIGLKDKTEELVDELEQTRSELNKAQDQIVQQAIQLKNCLAGVTVFSPDAPDGTGLAIMQNLEGKVVQVNNEWQFIVLDLGRAQVREQMEMLVARDDELIARVQISKVMNKISIAEVMPEVQTASIAVGDRVILPYPRVETETQRR